MLSKAKLFYANCAPTTSAAVHNVLGNAESLGLEFGQEIAVLGKRLFLQL
jgi:hypothetical protein